VESHDVVANESVDLRKGFGPERQERIPSEHPGIGKPEPGDDRFLLGRQRGRVAQSFEAGAASVAAVVGPHQLDAAGAAESVVLLVSP
jgi:hypothetical protein